MGTSSTLPLRCINHVESVECVDFDRQSISRLMGRVERILTMTEDPSFRVWARLVNWNGHRRSCAKVGSEIKRYTSRA